jgi:hypothetical protein
MHTESARHVTRFVTFGNSSMDMLVVSITCTNASPL